MKKLLSLLTALTLFPLSVSAFSDISEDHKNYEAIFWAKNTGIIQGYTDGTFRPDQNISRAEFLKIVFEAKKIHKTPLDKLVPDSDRGGDLVDSISQCGEYSKYTNKAYGFDYCIPKLWWWAEQGKVEDIKFRIEFYNENPEDEEAEPIAFLDLMDGAGEEKKETSNQKFIVTFPRNETSHFIISGDISYAKEISQIAEYMKNSDQTGKLPDESVQSPPTSDETAGEATSICDTEKYSFPDVDSKEWYSEYICRAKQEGIVKGYPNGDFRPNENISFVAAAKVVANIFSEEKIEEDSEIWYKNFVQYLEENDAIPSTVITREKKLTRSEMIEIIWNIQKNKKITAESKDISNAVDTEEDSKEIEENTLEEKILEGELSQEKDCAEYSEYTTLSLSFCLSEDWWWVEKGKTEDAISLVEFYEENPENEGAEPIAFLELREDILEKAYKQSLLEKLYIHVPRDEVSHLVVYGDAFYAPEMTKIAKYTEGIQGRSSDSLHENIDSSPEEKTAIVCENFDAPEDLTESYKVSGDRVYYKGNRIYISGETDDFEILPDHQFYDAKDAEFYYLKGQRKTCKDPKAGYANYTYCNINGEIYFDDTRIENADIFTFEILQSNSSDVLMFEYAKDANNVYFQGNIIEGADSATFEKSDSKGFHHDKNFVYKNGEELIVTQREKSDGTVVSSSSQDLVVQYEFYAMEKSPYIKDENGIYCHLKENSYRELQMDTRSFLFLGGNGTSGYSKDKEFVYFNCDRIEGADAESFEFLSKDEEGNILGKDKTSEYINGNISTERERNLLYEGDPVDDGNIKTEGENFSSENIKNTNHFTSSTKIVGQPQLLEETEEQTEENPKYTIQNNSVLFGSVKLPDVDANTFEILSENYEGNAYGRDAFRYYKNEKLILKRELPESLKGE